MNTCAMCGDPVAPADALVRRDGKVIDRKCSVALYRRSWVIKRPVRKRF